MKKIIAIACLTSVVACKQENAVMQIQQPQNKNIQDTTFGFFGTKVHDPFYGLEDDGSARTMQWVKDVQAKKCAMRFASASLPFSILKK
jgi:hypothetical protein